MAKELYTKGVGSIIHFRHEVSERDDTSLDRGMLSDQMDYVLPQKKGDFVRNALYCRPTGEADPKVACDDGDTEVAKAIPRWAVGLFFVGIVVIALSFFLALFVENVMTLSAISIGFFAVSISLWVTKYALK
jgi:hypothetical protein